MMDAEDMAWYNAHISDVLEVVGDDAFTPSQVIGGGYFSPAPDQ